MENFLPASVHRAVGRSKGVHVCKLLRAAPGGEESALNNVSRYHYDSQLLSPSQYNLFLTSRKSEVFCSLLSPVRRLRKSQLPSVLTSTYPFISCAPGGLNYPPVPTPGSSL